MFSRFMRKVFTLPPVEKRWLPEKYAHAFLGSNFTKNEDDTYIYWRLHCFGWVIAVFFSLLYLSSYFFNFDYNLGVYVISVRKPDILSDVVWSYSFIVTTIVFVLSMIHGYVLFHVNNIDVQNTDLVWWNSKAQFYEPYYKHYYKIAFFVILIAGYGSFGLPLLISGYYQVSDSIIFLMGTLLVLNFVSAYLAYYTFWNACVVYQKRHKLGRFSEQKQSNPENPNDSERHLTDPY